MARTPQDVTDAELGVLQALWDGGPATVRRLTDALYPRGGVSHYATVQKLLERLEAKGCVQRDRSTWPHSFAPAVSRDELIGLRLLQQGIVFVKLVPDFTDDFFDDEWAAVFFELLEPDREAECWLPRECDFAVACPRRWEAE